MHNAMATLFSVFRPKSRPLGRGAVILRFKREASQGSRVDPVRTWIRQSDVPPSPSLGGITNALQTIHMFPAVPQ